MDAPLFPEQASLRVELADHSLLSLLERGLQCARREDYAEGAAFFTLARERLAPDQVHLSASLNAFIEISAGYRQAQQALHEASRRFAEVDSAQQAQLASLEKLLPTLMKNTSIIAQPLTNSNGHQSPSEPQLLPETGSALPGLYFTCFGRFEVRRLNQTIALCSNRNGQTILRYLIAQPGHRATVDNLMAILWPEDEPEVAQPKLHIAISALRRSLNHGYKCETGCGYIFCKNGAYHLNPEVAIQTDVDEFLQCYQVGRQISERRQALYERACCLYTGPFLSEDMYADWSFLQREQLSQAHLAMCRALAGYYLESKRYEDAAKWATTILKENRCDEAAHRYLIQIYAAQGRRSDALQQYQRCERALLDDLGVPPMPETTSLLETILTSNDAPLWKNENKAKIKRK